MANKVPLQREGTVGVSQLAQEYHQGRLLNLLPHHYNELNQNVIKMLICQ